MARPTAKLELSTDDMSDLALMVTSYRDRFANALASLPESGASVMVEACRVRVDTSNRLLAEIARQNGQALTPGGMSR